MSDGVKVFCLDGDPKNRWGSIGSLDSVEGLHILYTSARNIGETKSSIVAFNHAGRSTQRLKTEMSLITKSNVYYADLPACHEGGYDKASALCSSVRSDLVKGKIKGSTILIMPAFAYNNFNNPHFNLISSYDKTYEYLLQNHTPRSGSPLQNAWRGSMGMGGRLWNTTGVERAGQNDKNHFYVNNNLEESFCHVMGEVENEGRYLWDNHESSVFLGNNGNIVGGAAPYNAMLEYLTSYFYLNDYYETNTRFPGVPAGPSLFKRILDVAYEDRTLLLNGLSTIIEMPDKESLAVHPSSLALMFLAAKNDRYPKTATISEFVDSYYQHLNGKKHKDDTGWAPMLGSF